MTRKYVLNKCLHLNLVGFLGCLGISLLTTTKTLAQQSNIIPDKTLGTESSRLNRNVLINGVNADSIDGGALREGSTSKAGERNLFHSFSEFNIDNGKSVYFVNPPGVQNIFTRVTGGNPSNILGTLGVDGPANLFLINPSGIVFGENASLDVQGSFVGTVANGIQFGEQGTFSATNPEIPGSLTVNPSALFFNQVQASGGIINKSQAPAGINPNGDETTGLRVPDGKSLLLVGGEIKLDGGRLRAYEGNIELASVTVQGTVELNISGNSFNLNVPEDVERGDISLVNESFISVFGAGGGNFTINARNLEISNSAIYAGIAENSDNKNAQAGDVKLNATDSIEIKDNAWVDNSVFSQGSAGNISLKAFNSISVVDSVITNNIELGGVGKGGNININSGSLDLTDGSEIQAVFRNTDVENNLPGGQDNTGNINTNVRDTVNIAGIKDGFNSRILNSVETGAIGNVGDININADSISLAEGGITNQTFGQGNSGNISLEASNSISLVDRSFIVNNIEAGGVGQGGNINIKAASLSVTDGSSIQALLRDADVENNLPGGQGNLGNIDINVRDTVTIAGIKDRFNSEIFNFVGIGAIGNSGDININADSLSLADGSEINAKTLGQGNAGNININARQNISLDGSGDVILSDGSNGTLFTRIINFVNPEATGNAGNIQLNTGNLSVTNGAFISSGTSGKGDSGNITINARDTISFDTVSSVDSKISTGGVGKGGDIRINTGTVILANGSKLSTSVSGEGNAGNIFVEARDGVKLDGFFSLQFNGEPFDSISAIESELLIGGVGKGGDIQITTGSLSANNGATLSAITSGQGNAGNININARNTVTFDQGSFAVTAVLSSANGKGGNIEITTGSLFLDNGGFFFTGTQGKGDAGNITINAGDRIIFDGVGSNNPSSGAFSTVQSNGIGNAGDIELTTGTLSLSNGGIVSVASFGKEDAAGNIFLQAQTLQLDKGFITAQTASTQGGNINLQISELLLLRNSSQITTTAGTAQAGGDGGSIDINSKFIVAPQNENSDITANAFEGNGGKVNIISDGIFGIESQESLSLKSDITASSQGAIAGEININTTDTSSIQNSFTEISPNIDTDAIIAGSCILRGNKRQENSFIITGTGGLRNKPGDELISQYSTGEVRNVELKNQTWKKGDPIIEPQGLYRLSSGELLLSRECS